jgi:hypothetical protein
MSALAADIHVFFDVPEGVDGWVKPGHVEVTKPTLALSACGRFNGAKGHTLWQ